jgi:hypothetical protein
MSCGELNRGELVTAIERGMHEGLNAEHCGLNFGNRCSPGQRPYGRNWRLGGLHIEVYAVGQEFQDAPTLTVKVKTRLSSQPLPPTKILGQILVTIFQVEALAAVFTLMTARNNQKFSSLPTSMTVREQSTLLDTPALARLLGFKEQTLRQWRCAGIGPDYIKLGPGPKAEVRYTREDVEAYIAHNRRANAVRAFIAEEQNERL